jgi:hypothetical protein
LLHSFRRGIATFCGFVVAGTFPLLAYLVPGNDGDRFRIAVSMALVALFLIGASRTPFTNRGTFRAGFEMLFTGAGAAGLAYLIGAVAGGLTEARLKPPTALQPSRSRMLCHKSSRDLSGSDPITTPLLVKSIIRSTEGWCCGHSGRPSPFGSPVLAKATQ